ncbi:MAG: hypothetical protein F6K10_33040 [Moorea sp. SIO2B7]|nr:hypothetical protein [Moorena sp. SIO2B7]
MIEKNFQLWGQFFELPTPDLTTIGQGFLKLGIFQLQKEKEKRSGSIPFWKKGEYTDIIFIS